MKNWRLLTVLLSLLSDLLFSQTIMKTINGNQFKFVTVSDNDIFDKKKVEIYRDNKLIITHVLSLSDGDCSSDNIELGKYKFEGADVIFYTYWASADRQSINIYPFGFRQQIYSVAKNGTIALKSSKLYIESFIGDYEKSPALKFLNNKPKSAAEVKMLNTYISKVEKKYSGTFVFGKDKLFLEKEVRKVLAPEIAESTKTWKDYYGNNVKI